MLEKYYNLGKARRAFLTVPSICGHEAYAGVWGNVRVSGNVRENRQELHQSNPSAAV